MDILMPQLGETVAEGKITKWFKSAGDAVKLGDNLFEIETDKTSMEVPATVAGVLAEIRVAVGEIVPVGATVAIISETGAAAASQSAPASTASRPAAATARVTAAAASAGAARSASSAPSRPLDPFFEVRTDKGNYGPARLAEGGLATPLARRLAAQAGVDLTRVAGSGPHGRVVGRDITPGTAPSVKSSMTAAMLSADQIKALYRDTTFEEIPVDSLRRVIALRLVQAKQTIPHFYLMADIAIDALLVLREDANNDAPKNADGAPAFKLSVNDLIIKAWARALQAVPAANAVWAEDRILRFKHSDIGVAVAIEGGLITPIIRQADVKSLSAISREMRELAVHARERRLLPEQYQGGSSSISNLGMYGIREFAAIINPPHGTILAVGAVRRQAVETADGGIAFASLMTVTLSCDHRVVDGALGAELLTAFKGFVEKPVTALV